MLFNSYFFLLYFFPIFITIYLLVRKQIKLANIIIIIFSLIFYASFGIENLPVLIIPLVLDYILGNAIYKAKKKKNKRIFAGAAIIINILILGYFKYFLLFNDVVNGITHYNFIKDTIKIIPPVGISFITFQRISYIMDILRGQIKPAKSFLSYATYACLFSHLISGPIVRFSKIKDNLLKRNVNSSYIFEGSKYFAIGLFLKVCIADQLFRVENTFTGSLNSLHFYDTVFLLLFFSLRIYVDFSGYSLMAIGIAKFMGFNFPQNFDSPYRSASITEFWRRWNITLSNWLRDYLYIPLGGNRKGKKRTYVNLLLTMLLAGLWHGASWNFIVWGGLHGSYLVIERIAFINKMKNILPKYINHILTFCLITITWSAFKFTNPGDIFTVMKNILLPDFSPMIRTNHNLLLITPFILIAVLWSFFLGEKFIEKIKPGLINSVIITCIFIIAVISTFIVKNITFIYAQF